MVHRTMGAVIGVALLFVSVGSLLANPQLRNTIATYAGANSASPTGGQTGAGGRQPETLVFADDFESGNGTKWNPPQATAPTPTLQPVVDTNNPHTGTYSADLSAIYRSQKDLPGSPQVWIARFWFYIPSGQSPTEGGSYVLSLAPYDGTHATGYVALGLHENYTVRLDNGIHGLPAIGSEGPLSVDTWHYAEIQARYGTPGRAQLAIDGYLIVDSPHDFTVSDDPLKTTATVIMGRYNDNEPKWYIDDLRVSTAADFQPMDSPAVASGGSTVAKVGSPTGAATTGDGSSAGASGPPGGNTSSAAGNPDPPSTGTGSPPADPGTASSGPASGGAGTGSSSNGQTTSSPGGTRLVFADDFETGDGSKWNRPDATTAVVTLQPIVDIAHPHAGKYSADFTTVYRSQKNLPGSPAVWVASFWLYIPRGQSPTDGGAFVLSLAPYDGTHPTGYVGLGLHEDYTVRLDNGMNDVGPTQGPVAPPLSLDTWHFVQIQARFGTPGRAVLAIDGNVVLDDSNDFTVSDDPLKTAATVIMGRFNENETRWFIDDIQVTTAPDFPPVDPPAASSAGGTAADSATTGAGGSNAGSPGNASSGGTGSAAVAGATSSATQAVGSAGNAASDGSVSSNASTTQGDPASQGQADRLWADVDDDNGLQSIGGYAALKNYAAVRFQNWLFDEGQNPQQQARSANPAIRVFFYDMPSRIFTWEGDYGAINGHEEWFAHDGSGNRIPGSDQNSFLPDATNPAYRAYRISRVMSYINQYNLDGFFWDGPPLDDNNGGVWSQFLKEFKAALGQKIMILNATAPNPNYYTDVQTAYFQIADGTNLEVLDYSGTSYDWWRQMYQRNVGAGKRFVLSSGTRDHHKQMAMYALHLMFYDQGGYFDTQDADFPELHISLGNPAGPPQQMGSVWTRQFANAMVTLDVNSGDASIQPLQ